VKTIVLSILFALAASILSYAQELRTITAASGLVNIPASSIVQILGIVAESVPLNTSGGSYTPPSMTQTFADGTKVTTQSLTPNNGLLGSVFSGVTSISVKNGKYSSTDLAVALTVKIMSEASQVVSPPLVLPVDDQTFSISLETSTDMQDWVPAFPGDYLGSSNHRFFRVKAIKKPAATPAAPAAPAK